MKNNTAQKVLGMFLQKRDIFNDSNGEKIHATSYYDLEWHEDAQKYSVIPHVRIVIIPMANGDNTVN